MNKKYDIKMLKKMASGHWIEIFSELAPELDEACSEPGRHVPCFHPDHPNSKDGLRAFEDVNETGGVICNTCGPRSDGIATLRWVRNWGFLETLEKISDYLKRSGIQTRKNNHKERTRHHGNRL